MFLSQILGLRDREAQLVGSHDIHDIANVSFVSTTATSHSQQLTLQVPHPVAAMTFALLQLVGRPMGANGEPNQSPTAEPDSLDALAGIIRFVAWLLGITPLGLLALATLAIVTLTLDLWQRIRTRAPAQEGQVMPTTSASSTQRPLEANCSPRQLTSAGQSSRDTHQGDDETEQTLPPLEPIPAGAEDNVSAHSESDEDSRYDPELLESYRAWQQAGGESDLAAEDSDEREDREARIWSQVHTWNDIINPTATPVADQQTSWTGRPAESAQPQYPELYRTMTGQCYHVSGCRSLEHSRIGI